jgi:hypothetical protein
MTTELKIIYDQPILDKKAIQREYIKQWRARNKEKVNNYSLKSYIKKVTDNPEYRDVLKERTKQRTIKLKLEKCEEINKKRGRPRKTQNPEMESEAFQGPYKVEFYNQFGGVAFQGRPRKY